MHALFLENSFTPDLHIPSMGKASDQVFLRLNSAYWPPLFWWALFNRKNLREQIDADGKKHHFLLATKAEVLNTWFERQEALKALVPLQDQHLIQEFTRFIQEAMGAGYVQLYISPLDDSQNYTLQDWSSIINERDGQWLRLEQAKTAEVLEEFDSLYMDWDQIQQDYQNPKPTNPYILFAGELKGRWPNPNQAQEPSIDTPLSLSETTAPIAGQAHANTPVGVSLEAGQNVAQKTVEQVNPNSVTPTQKASQNRTPKLSWILVLIAALLLSYTFFKS